MIIARDSAFDFICSFLCFSGRRELEGNRTTKPCLVVVSVADVAMLDAYPSLLDSVGQHFTQ
jgi:hypothetical protein